MSYTLTPLESICSLFMANLSKKKVLQVSLVMFLVLVASSEARLSRRFSTMPKKIDSNLILRKLGYDESKLKKYRRRLDSDPDRVSPGGPDSHHH